MTADTDLIAGPYHPPTVSRGDWLDDERYGRVEVGGWSNGRISWPRRKKTGTHALVLCSDLVRAVRTESVMAITHWWGVSETTVWSWRRALGVDTTDGSERIAHRGVPPDAAARGRARAAQPDAIAKMAATKTGRPAPPTVRAGLLRAVQAPKPPGWGARANAWMLAGKRRP